LLRILFAVRDAEAVLLNRKCGKVGGVTKENNVIKGDKMLLVMRSHKRLFVIFV
jgi:hypothetical protein